MKTIEEAILTANIDPLKKINTADVMENLDVLNECLGYFRKYPDILLDLLVDPATNWKQNTYLRIKLRAMFRYQTNIFVEPRGTGKTWGAVLGLLLMGILYPGIKMAICAPAMKQSKAIAIETISSIFRLFPMISNEYVTQKVTDLEFGTRSGSILKITAPLDSERGAHYHVMLIEELCQHIPELVQPINEEMVTELFEQPPGMVDTNSPQNRVIYVTTNSSRHEYAYEKYKEILVSSMVVPPNTNYYSSAMSCGWPVSVYITKRRTLEDILAKKRRGTYNAAAYAKENENIWTGASSESWFQLNRLERLRKIKYWQPRADKRDGCFYVLGVDFARGGRDQTAFVILKVSRKNDYFIKRVVYLETLSSNTPSQDQVLRLKQLAELYEVKQVAIDRQSMGIVFADLLMIKTLDTKTGSIYPAYGSINKDELRKNNKPDSLMILNALVPTEKSNDIYHTRCYSEIDQGKLRLLVSYNYAKRQMNGTKKFHDMDYTRKIRRLAPYQTTDILIDQMLNLRCVENKSGIGVERINTKGRKDLFSALEYAVYAVSIIEESEKKRKYKKDAAFFSKYMSFR